MSGKTTRSKGVPEELGFPLHVERPWTSGGMEGQGFRQKCGVLEKGSYLSLALLFPRCLESRNGLRYLERETGLHSL